MFIPDFWCGFISAFGVEFLFIVLAIVLYAIFGKKKGK